jgi:hypothetical protein
VLRKPHLRRSVRFLVIGLGLLASCASVMIHRDTIYANEPTFGGGWPLVFLVDQPGVSVTGRLTLLEDVAYPLSFVLNTAFWMACIWFGTTVGQIVWYRGSEDVNDTSLPR